MSPLATFLNVPAGLLEMAEVHYGHVQIVLGFYHDTYIDYFHGSVESVRDGV